MESADKQCCGKPRYAQKQKYCSAGERQVCWIGSTAARGIVRLSIGGVRSIDKSFGESGRTC
jgi:hypothetical protein